MSPRKLVSTFPPPDEHVHTLYDNWEVAVARFPHVSEGCGWRSSSRRARRQQHALMATPSALTRERQEG